MIRWSWALGVCCAVLTACVGPGALESPVAGRTAAYVPGLPNFDMESVVRMDGRDAVVEVFYALPLASLVFIQSEPRYEAGYELVVQLIRQSDASVALERSHSETIAVAEYDSTKSFHSHRGRVELHTQAGEFVVEAVLTDLQSGEAATRRQAITVAPSGGEPSMSRILLEARRSSESFEPVVSLHLPALADSVRATIELYNVQDGTDFEVAMELVRFRTDTSVAAPPYWLIPPRGSLAYRGVDYGAADTIQTTRRAVNDAGESVTVQFLMPPLSTGFYRLQVQGENAVGEDLMERHRIFSVKGSSFPRMTRLEELIEAMAYIAYDNEIDAILEGGTPSERKQHFDAFWGSLVSNRTVAANLIELYFSRIEEANLLFTGYKEGWRTDRGMIFTILGPPVYVDRRLDAEIWYYSYGDRDPVNTFVFERVREEENAVFETYVLQRRPYYQNAWARAIDRWRSGDVL